MTVSAVRSFRRMRTGFRCRKRMLQKYVVALCLEKNLDDIGCISASHSVIFMQLWPKRNRLLTAATFDSSQVAMTWPQFIALRYGVSAAFLPGAERRVRKRSFHFQCSGLFRFVRKFTNSTCNTCRQPLRLEIDALEEWGHYRQDLLQFVQVSQSHVVSWYVTSFLFLPVCSGSPSRFLGPSVVFASMNQCYISHVDPTKY